MTPPRSRFGEEKGAENKLETKKKATKLEKTEKKKKKQPHKNEAVNPIAKASPKPPSNGIRLLSRYSSQTEEIPQPLTLTLTLNRYLGHPEENILKKDKNGKAPTGFFSELEILCFFGNEEHSTEKRKKTDSI